LRYLGGAKPIRNHVYSAITNRTRAIVSIAVVLFSLGSSAAYADTLDEQIKAAQQQVAQQQNDAAALHAQADNYQQQVNQYNAQINYVQAQINLNQAESNQVLAQIEDAKAKMAAQKAILSENIKTMYLTSTVSPLEMLASSNDLSSFFDQQQYQDKVKDKIQSALAEIVQLKASLESKQASLSNLLASQNAQKQQLSDTRAQLNQLLAVAAQSAAAADQQVKDSNAKVASLKAQQAAAIAAASRHVNFGGGPSGSGGACATGDGNGGYPALWCNAAQDSLVDSWGMYNRECVSYAAWAASVRFGHNVPYWGGRGNAKQWPDNARGAGIPVDSNPQVGDVAIWTGGPYGHAMIVEQVRASTVIVSSMNGDNAGHFFFDEWSRSSLVFIHFH
jgi:peptidoglycan hydrolase CwlO-like protein